ncbi:hypothetical protein [Paraburkholderia phytofirmans]|uniref:Uncharacterized protein n=1 Tax=Paraburkholderia phytofirmans (strain DSM 17436 / LMG 22146 / PsJN) TaxID=398527 RepID=B2TH44_PARPJ|nr:hypothetical protein [Paraburkholderia phytofirmans]ACD21593.1 conserved hypothetical protein [Paraburkholderia phytofirmans PsJN]
MDKTESRIARRVVSALLAAGYGISIDDGEAETPVLHEERKIIREMSATCSDRIYVWTRDSVADAETRRNGWVLMVYGNGIDVLTDYTTNLEATLKPVNDWIYSELAKSK